MKILGKSGVILFESNNDSMVKTLQKAISEKTDLSGANLYRAYLYGANFYEADLSGADLSGADLSRANLSGADLSGANLSGAYLYGADLSGADLSGVDLGRANLYRADLSGANLYRAYLYGANFYEADLSGVKNLEENSLWFKQTRILPDEGDIIGFKKCKDDIIVKLLIPNNAKRSHAFGRKCRAEEAVVLEIFGAEEAVSNYDHNFKYIKGNIVKPDEPFSEDWKDECQSGIHFFITKVEAENY